MNFYTLYVAILVAGCPRLCFPLNLTYTGDENSSTDHRKLVQWSKVYASILSNNVVRNCKHNGQPICCSSLSKGETNTNRRFTDREIHRFRSRGICTRSRTYHPSPYEVRHYNKALELDLILDFNERRRALLAFMSSPTELTAVKIWLQRVRTHMNGKVSHKTSVTANGNVNGPTSEDFEYLSYFQISQTCQNNITRSWIEWIEPLSVHGRHPLSMGHCGHPDTDTDTVREAYKASGVEVKFAHMFDVDYILLKSGDMVSKAEVTSQGFLQRNVKVMLDAGASRFDSSQWWFTCAYAQQSVHFDTLVGWELSLLEPQDFWKHVPPGWRDNYKFYNIPISADPLSASNPLRVAKEMGLTEQDFLAFKLDVDTPEVELPIALALLQQQDFYRLVDEFFFEIHFRCEIMMFCGWDDRMPLRFGELGLSRPAVLRYFGDLRRKGVRAHFWP
eukprot:gene8087-16593_t